MLGLHGALLPTPSSPGPLGPGLRLVFLEAAAAPRHTGTSPSYRVERALCVRPRAEAGRSRLFPDAAERQEQAACVEFVFPYTSPNQYFKLHKNSFGILIEISLVLQVSLERPNAFGQSLVFEPGTRCLRLSTAAAMSPITYCDFSHSALVHYASIFDAL